VSQHTHRYAARVTWTGDRGQGTHSYRSYGREHEIAIAGKPPIVGSSDPLFRGDAGLHNPEDLLVSSLSACHMLWYLHLAAESGIVVRGYVDDAIGSMFTDADSGRFSEVVLKPTVTISAGDPATADALHHLAHQACFIANSVNFPVRCEPRIVVTD
jgi:organic hydroperoxide reductase OsmC/OhrA